ncbi:hypothetical protein LTR99_008611 [Exophiala xenobiotica]|uniref:Uncharacterized protein n=1 Tax=Vermiconidia calcicola TaxID=1690605 RepID=A0AAV9Q367_9PEZI|nr:hypothetical protein H2202_004333 [Exophiala xenobiotica]KAK5533000.1 hypothetical protein LTR25_007705 [Vermiconidia calcicola]KAK5534334.1 hypothetical protein LTR23_008763 [Chaetothyriales sp. CCFEE 6169]KAK5191662.1 hypothetical protein LTR92_008242 [Exophiala xenobiotica]KAK5211223.1 hypothetical protein LTR41_002682 [Exophiala xenobiotica]
MSASTLRTTAERYISAFETLDSDLFRSLQSPRTYSHTFGPASASPPPPQDGAHFAQHIADLRGIMRGFPVYTQAMYVNEAARQVVVHATSETWFRDEVKDTEMPESDWLYHGEYIFILDMDESGEKITKVFEFLDSKGTDALRQLMKRARANQAKFKDKEIRKTSWE